MSNEMDGVPWIDYSIERGPVLGAAGRQIGLKLRVKAKREVEDFFKALSNGRQVEIEAFGNGWVPSGLDAEKQLQVYVTDLPATKTYTLGRPAQPLLIDTGRAVRLDDGSSEMGQITNLSFLALVGISQEDGLVFGVTGMYSASYAKKLHQHLGSEIKRFLHDYVVPVTFNLQIINRQ